MDYGYNIMINVFIGLINVFSWLFWCLINFNSSNYVWRCAICVVLTLCFAGLELIDFTPIGWSIDAHALWHFSTIFLPYFWYKFVIDDSYKLLLLRNNLHG